MYLIGRVGQLDKRLKLWDVSVTFFVVCWGSGAGLALFLMEHLLTLTRRLIAWLLRLKNLDEKMRRRSRRHHKVSP